jgi:hypothetical protein
MLSGVPPRGVFVPSDYGGQGPRLLPWSPLGSKAAPRLIACNRVEARQVAPLPPSDSMRIIGTSHMRLASH